MLDRVKRENDGCCIKVDCVLSRTIRQGTTVTFNRKAATICSPHVLTSDALNIVWRTPLMTVTGIFGSKWSVTYRGWQLRTPCRLHLRCFPEMRECPQVYIDDVKIHMVGNTNEVEEKV